MNGFNLFINRKFEQLSFDISVYQNNNHGGLNTFLKTNIKID